MTDPRDLDVRIVHRQVQRGRVSSEAYQAHLAELPDLEGEAEFVNYEQQFREEAREEGGPPPPVFVGAPSPAEPKPAPAAPPPAAPGPSSPDPGAPSPVSPPPTGDAEGSSGGPFPGAATSPFPRGPDYRDERAPERPERGESGGSGEANGTPSTSGPDASPSDATDPKGEPGSSGW